MVWTVITVRSIKCLSVTNFGCIKEYYDLFSFYNLPMLNSFEWNSGTIVTRLQCNIKTIAILEAFMNFDFNIFSPCADQAIKFEILSHLLKTKILNGHHSHLGLVLIVTCEEFPISAEIEILNVWKLHLHPFNYTAHFGFSMRVTCANYYYNYISGKRKRRTSQRLYFTHMLIWGIIKLMGDLKFAAEEFPRQIPLFSCQVGAERERIRSDQRTKSKLQFPCAKCEKLPIQFSQRKLISIVGKLNKNSRQMELQILLSSLLICMPKAFHFTINRGLPTPSKTQQI